MAVELGALALRIEAVGDKAVLQSLGLIEATAKRVDSGRISRSQVMARAAQFDAQMGVAAQTKIEAATTKTTAAISRQTAAAQLFGRTGINAMTGVAFGIGQLAATGETSFRSLATAVSTFASFFGPVGILVSLISSTALVMSDFWNRQKKLVADLGKEIDQQIVARLERLDPVGTAAGKAGRLRTALDEAIGDFNFLKQRKAAGAALLFDDEEKALQKVILARQRLIEAEQQGADARVVIAADERRDHEAALRRLEELRQARFDVIEGALGKANASKEVVGGFNEKNWPGLGTAQLKPRIELSVAEMQSLFGQSMSDAAQQMEADAQAAGESIASGLIAGFASGLGSGGLGDAFAQGTASFLQSLGSFALQAGIEGLKVAQLMANLQAFLSAHPLLAIGAAIALIAAGTALGGRGGGGRGASSFSGSGAASASEALRLIITDPNTARLGGLRAASAPAGGPNISVIGVSSPEGQRLIGESNARFVRRGGR